MLEQQTNPTSPPTGLSAEGQTVTPSTASSIKKFQIRFPLFALSCFLLAALISTLNNLPFCYDGGYQLLDLLERQIPPTPHWRVGTAIFMLPAMLSLKITNNLEITSFFFSLGYALVPFLSLTGCWLSVRKTQPKLILWPTIAIGLLSVMAQPVSVSENLLTCLLAWPLFLGLFAPPHKHRTLYLSLLAFWLTTLHLISVPFILCTAIAAFLIESKAKRTSQHSGLNSLPVILITLALLRIAFFFLLNNAYEMSVINNDSMLNAFKLGFKDLTLIPVISLPFLTTTIFISSIKPKLNKKTFWLSLALIITESTAALVWSSHGENWHQAFHYGRFLFLPFCLLMLCTFIDSRWESAIDAQPPKGRNKERNLLLNATAFSFLITMSTQCHLWHNYIVSLNQTLKESPLKIVNLESLKDFKLTPINHWSASSLAILIQGRHPKTLVLSENASKVANSTGEVHIATWEKAFKNRFFKLPVLTQEK